MNGITLLRTAEKESPDAAKKILLQPPLLGRNGVGVTAFPHVTNCSAIWKFSPNQEAAKTFLSDLPDAARVGYEQSRGSNFPIYPKAVPDISVRLSKDSKADPPYKYEALKDALHWTPNVGVPGVATPAFMEIFSTSVVPRMVARVLKDGRSPEDAAASGAAEIQRIVNKWKQAA